MAETTDQDRRTFGTTLGAAVPAETRAPVGELEDVRARGYWEQVWRRFKNDRVAIAGGAFIVFLFLAAFVGAPIAAAILGHGPNDIFSYSGIDPNTLLPVGPMTHVEDVGNPGHTTLFVLGASDTLGRDEFLRLLYGAQASLEVAVLSTIGVVTIGTVLGSLAGYYRGWIDTLISRVTEITMAFPFLLFIIALAATLGQRLDNVTFGIFGKGVVTLVLVFSLFGWFFPARIVRAVVLSVREKEFVEAARMVGASDARIIRSHILPHLASPLIVFSTLAVAGFVLAEAGLSFRGVGIKLPTASWGNLLQSATDFYTSVPWLMVWPGLAVLLTTLSFNLLGDGLRDAFDPRSMR